MAKAVKISDEAYKKLIKMRSKMMKRSLRNQTFFSAMGIGAFAGWLILTKIKELEK